MPERSRPGKKPVIVSVQSQLVYGCAGNSAAVPVLQSLGAIVHAVPTVLLSNTPHYPTLGGQTLDASLVGELLGALLDRIEPGEIDGIITGYIGSAATAGVVAGFIDKVRERNTGVTVLCDPVIGDIDVGAYVDDRVAASLCEQLVPRADILAPNLFEARYVLGDNQVDGLRASTRLLETGASIAIVTGNSISPGDRLATIASTASASWQVITPRLDLRPTGTGDIFAAAFMVDWLQSRAVDHALERGVDVVLRHLEDCRQSGSPEIDPTMASTARPAHVAQRLERPGGKPR